MKYLQVYCFILWLVISNVAYPEELYNQKVIANGYILERQWSRMELVDIFTRNRIWWPNSKKITVFTRQLDSVEHKLFVIDVLNLSPFQFRSRLDSVIYAGKNTPVVEVTSDEEMLLKLSLTPYSIGYVNSTVMINDKLNIIKITYE